MPRRYGVWLVGTGWLQVLTPATETRNLTTGHGDADKVTVACLVATVALAKEGEGRVVPHPTPTPA